MTEYTITRDDAERDLRALRGALSGIPTGVSSSVVPALQELADAIEEQVKPTIEEPTEFGSLVRAISGFSVTGTLWQMASGHGEHYWEDEHGCVVVWSELQDPEVLRVGIGERLDVAPEDTEDYRAGVADTKAKVLRWLRQLRAEALTAERQNAHDKAIKLVEELQP